MSSALVVQAGFQREIPKTHVNVGFSLSSASPLSLSIYVLCVGQCLACAWTIHSRSEASTRKTKSHTNVDALRTLRLVTKAGPASAIEDAPLPDPANTSPKPNPCLTNNGGCGDCAACTFRRSGSVTCTCLPGCTQRNDGRCERE